MQPLLQWKSNEYYTTWVCVCSLRYPACNAHTSYFHLACPALLQYFSTISHKRRDFRKKSYWTQNVYFDFLYNFCLKKWARYDQNCILVFVWIVRFEWNLNFRDRFSRNRRISNFMKIRQVEAELFYMNGRTDSRADMTKLIVAFRNLANAPSNWLYRRTRILGYACRANSWTAATTARLLAFWSISIGGWWNILTLSLQWTITGSWFIGTGTEAALHVTILNEKAVVNICMFTCKQ